MFIRDFLGPAFKKLNIKTKIIVYDHNADAINYPIGKILNETNYYQTTSQLIDILSDPKAAAYVTGSAFHLYAGQMSALSIVHSKFPDKGIYFTEQYTAAPESDLQFGTFLL